MSITIRAPRPDELERVREIEWAAGTLFNGTEFAAVAEHEPASVEELAAYTRDGRAWVATDADDVPAGYAVVDIVDGLAHLEQLSVHPDYARQGIGTALLEHTCTWARHHGYDAVTLTTFNDIAWNAPYYAARGFTPMRDDEVGPELRALRALEAEHGLDPTKRVCMRRAV
jgi:GNAT superfamily N-acetyltransferase